MRKKDEILQKNPQLSHTERQWQNKFFGMGEQCYYCNRRLTLKEATKDHRIPTCRRGSDAIKNIVPACLPCNQQKGWRTEEEFRALRASFPKPPQPTRGINLNHEGMSLAERDEPQLAKLRRESEGGCPIGFKSWPA